MQVDKASALEGVRYEYYVGRVSGSEGMKMEDGEEKVLIRIRRESLRCHALVMLG